jgi:hypothetical protein
MRSSISTRFANFPYEDRVSEGKMDKYRNTDNCPKIASKLFSGSVA